EDLDRLTKGEIRNQIALHLEVIRLPPWFTHLLLFLRNWAGRRSESFVNQPPDDTEHGESLY
ncbi:MAG TPA: hypothetical protein VE201_06070, partial [Nitrospirales bacterium]|nr:hypothetical protein [Nitrospirales bacterium]